MGYLGGSSFNSLMVLVRWGSNGGLIAKARLGFKPQANSESPLKRTEEKRNSVGLNRLSLLATELIPWRAETSSGYIRFTPLAQVK